MILIALSWIYILLTAVNFGYVLHKWLRMKPDDFVVLCFSGLLSVTLFASGWAFFGRINWEFHSVLLVLNIVIFLSSKTVIRHIYTEFRNKLIQLDFPFRILLAIITVLILAQCAAAPYIPDNESYYIQTIKWFNEYGFVKGLANLHLFFGQCSGWHITQSVFSFSFLYSKFNDLSGFCLLLGNIFALLRLRAYFENANKNYLIIGLLPLANVFLFQFISTPSPDIPVYVLSFVIFFYFLENYPDKSGETFRLLTVLVLFALYIKSTSLILALFPLAFLVRDFRKLLPQLFRPILFALLVAGLFFAKNYIISGHPFFPVITSFSNPADYAVPEKMARYYYTETQLFAFKITEAKYNALSAADLFRHWLMMPKLHGLFNKISILLLLVGPFFIWLFANKKALWICYVAMFLQLILLFTASPQYRFFMNFMLFFGLMLLAHFVSGKKIILSALYLSLLPCAYFLLVPVNLENVTKNKLARNTAGFSAQYLIFPHGNSKSDTEFRLVRNGNLEYYSPIDNPFFWGNGDGKLPCVNQLQIDYFEYDFHLKPQLRGNTLKDGFYAKATSGK